MGIAERYEKVEEELAQECALAGRDPKEVRLVAVSKTVGVEGVGEAYAAGARDFGENRPDQIVPKSQAFPDARWHFIGTSSRGASAISSTPPRLSTPSIRRNMRARSTKSPARRASCRISSSR